MPFRMIVNGQIAEVDLRRMSPEDLRVCQQELSDANRLPAGEAYSQALQQKYGFNGNGRARIGNQDDVEVCRANLVAVTAEVDRREREREQQQRQPAPAPQQQHPQANQQAQAAGANNMPVTFMLGNEEWNTNEINADVIRNVNRAALANLQRVMLAATRQRFPQLDPTNADCADAMRAIRLVEQRNIELLHADVRQPIAQNAPEIQPAAAQQQSQTRNTVYATLQQMTDAAAPLNDQTLNAMTLEQLQALASRQEAILANEANFIQITRTNNARGNITNGLYDNRIAVARSIIARMEQQQRAAANPAPAGQAGNVPGGQQPQNPQGIQPVAQPNNAPGQQQPPAANNAAPAGNAPAQPQGQNQSEYEEAILERVNHIAAQRAGIIAEIGGNIPPNTELKIDVKYPATKDTTKESKFADLFKKNEMKEVSVKVSIDDALLAAYGVAWSARAGGTPADLRETELNTFLAAETSVVKKIGLTNGTPAVGPLTETEKAQARYISEMLRLSKLNSYQTKPASEPWQDNDFDIQGGIAPVQGARLSFWPFKDADGNPAQTGTWTMKAPNSNLETIVKAKDDGKVEFKAKTSWGRHQASVEVVYADLVEKAVAQLGTEVKTGQQDAAGNDIFVGQTFNINPKSEEQAIVMYKHLMAHSKAAQPPSQPITITFQGNSSVYKAKAVAAADAAAPEINALAEGIRRKKGDPLRQTNVILSGNLPAGPTEPTPNEPKTVGERNVAAAAPAVLAATVGRVQAPAPVQQQAPAPGQQAPAPVQQAPAPVQQAPAPVQQAPAPVQQAPAPVQQAPAPVQQAPAPVQQAPAPVQQAVVRPPQAAPRMPQPQTGALAAVGMQNDVPDIMNEPVPPQNIGQNGQQQRWEPAQPPQGTNYDLDEHDRTGSGIFDQQAAGRAGLGHEDEVTDETIIFQGRGRTSQSQPANSGTQESSTGARTALQTQSLPATSVGVRFSDGQSGNDSDDESDQEQGEPRSSGGRRSPSFGRRGSTQSDE